MGSVTSRRPTGIAPDAINATHEQSSPPPKAKKKKESFFRRVGRQARDTASLAALLITEPRAFPAALLARLKRAFRAVWSARGGGLYACGFFITFLWLEVTTFFGEVLAAGSVGGFLSEQLIEIFVRFTVQSLENTVSALIWPVHIIEWSPGWGIALLAGMYLLFVRVVKAPLARWLFGEETPSADHSDDE